MPPIYNPYYISDGSHELQFDSLTTTGDPITHEDCDIIRDVCVKLSNDDVRRVIELEEWCGGGTEQAWRNRARTWSDREAKYVIECLRWERIKIKYQYQLCFEVQEKLQRQRSGAQDAAAQMQTAQRQKEQTGENHDTHEDEEDTDQGVADGQQGNNDNP